MKSIRGWVIAAWVVVIAMVNVESVNALNVGSMANPKPKHRIVTSKKDKHKYDPHRHSRDKHHHKPVYQSI